jgi:hypothetical protein
MALTDAQSGAKILDGTIPVEVTLAGAVVKGDAVGYSSGWKRALATAGSVVQMKATAAMDGQIGDKIVVYFGKTRLGGRFGTSMTVGSPVYVEEGSGNGKYTETIPSTQNDSTKQVGISISTSEVLLDPNADPDTVHA